ncbi:hypothetical protein B4U79_03169 [Dinothrombium tinctorium]|uniref:Uncharacterized protein n=1 Tax=Dinothrombium tinctorium TaxID=1965070 RepID=A0A3S3PCA7_9ACAR|nr:hypothetical protein B4U79_03333 [Dinothrombium tinctorium]RWS16635.1 hypothetical protein B4U79_03169 [Dinothrombium tinctorium]
MKHYFVIVVVLVVSFQTYQVQSTLQSIKFSGNDRGSRSGFDPNYGIWGSNQGVNRFDVSQLVPILLIVGLMIMLLPILTSCLTTLFTPLNFTHGKKKREAVGIEDDLPSMRDIVLNLLVNLEKAIEKYGKL